jgi:hypothetical protein
LPPEDFVGQRFADKCLTAKSQDLIEKEPVQKHWHFEAAELPGVLECPGSIVGLREPIRIFAAQTPKQANGHFVRGKIGSSRKSSFPRFTNVPILKSGLCQQRFRL